MHLKCVNKVLHPDNPDRFWLFFQWMPWSRLESEKESVRLCCVWTLAKRMMKGGWGDDRWLCAQVPPVMGRCTPFQQLHAMLWKLWVVSSYEKYKWKDGLVNCLLIILLCTVLFEWKDGWWINGTLWASPSSFSETCHWFSFLISRFNK